MIRNIRIKITIYFWNLINNTQTMHDDDKVIKGFYKMNG